MKNVLITTLITLSALPLLILVGSLYLYFKYEVGDTWGLRERLEDLNHVRRVENYQLSEGTVAATLVLSEGTIRLNGLDNGNFLAVGQVTIVQLNGRELMCELPGRRVYSLGLRMVVVNQYFGNGKIANIQDVIDNFEVFEKVFAQPTFSLPSLLTRFDQEQGLGWDCKVG